MSRYISEFSFSVPASNIFASVSQFLNAKGYEYTQYNNENVFKRGSGVLTAPKFIKITVMQNTVQIEAWIKIAILPGVYAGELDLKGVIGVAAKKPLKSVVEQLESMLVSAGCTLKTAQNTFGQQTLYTQQAQNINSFNSQNSQQNYASSGCQKFCTKCGAPLEQGIKFCTKCGQPTDCSGNTVNAVTNQPQNQNDSGNIFANQQNPYYSPSAAYSSEKTNAFASYCTKCGAPIEQGTKFCTKCGKPVL